MKIRNRIACTIGFLICFDLQAQTGPTPLPSPKTETNIPSEETGFLPPGITAGLSIIPGLGQISNGDYWEAPIWFGTVIGLGMIGAPQAAFDIWMYNIYDAYRDAHPVSRRYTHHTVFENYLANYNPANFLDPYSAPVVSTSFFLAGDQYQLRNVSPGRILKYSLVGLGEEALFRGFLFAGMTDLFNNPWLGGTLSSLIFGAAHYPQPWPAFVFRTGIGALFCFQTFANKWDMRKSIFTHSWWDVFVSPPSSLTVSPLRIFGRSTGVEKIEFKYSFEF